MEGTPEQLKSERDGDTVVVELESPGDAAGAAMRLVGMRGVREVSVDTATPRARAGSGSRAVPTVLAALDEADLTVVSVTVGRPTLDDVYLRHAGRRFEVTA